ncbi:MAG: metal-dependent transcriptional regulator [Chloroflexi bacterium]|nr:metal-dependent transcriptional regulator [Chloroflexota bacterium]
MPDNACATGTVEEYLEAILNMTSEGKTVLGARLAERLQVSPPTVTATLQRMRRDGLVRTRGKKGVLLTDKGMKLAMGVVRRHRLAERMLTDILKIPWYESHQEACLLEHAISEKVMDRLYEVLGKPTTCPHGNPIPTDDVLPPLRGMPLDTVAAGTTVVVERISEEANRCAELMAYLEKAGIRPGASITVKELAEYAGTMSIVVGKRTSSLGIGAAAMVWVMPSSKA